MGPENLVSVELDPDLAEAARRALARLGWHPTVHTGDGAAGFAAAAPFDRIIATAATDHIPPAWIRQLAPSGAIVADLRGSLTGSLVRVSTTDSGTVEGPFLNLPGAFMPLRTQLGSPHRDGESWDQVLDQRNPQRGTTPVDPGLVADDRSLRFMAQLNLAGRRLRGFLRSGNGTELSGHGSDGSWVVVGLHPDKHRLYLVAQGGPQRLWDTIESCHAAWQRLGQPGVTRFGVTAHEDTALQHVWFDHPNSAYRWPLPL